MTMIKLDYVKEYIDKNGKVRRYLRRKGKPLIPLPGLPGSDEFMAAYKAGIADIAKPKPRHGDGTIGSLVLGFYQSSAFSNLAPSSQQRYRLVLDKFAAEDGHRLVRDMPRRVAISIIEEIGEKTPGMANLSASVLRRLFAYAIKKELRKDNPFSAIEPYKLGSHHTWTEDEIAAYRETWPIGTRERFAFDLLLYTGQRVGDVAGMRHTDIRDGAIHIVTEKTEAELSIPIHPDLLTSIEACPSHGPTLIGYNGRPISGQALGVFLQRAAHAAGLPKRCKPHGLRKSHMRRLAEYGSSSKEIASMSGHRTLREIERYTAKADQTRLALAAVARIPVSHRAPESVSPATKSLVD
jgi:enterobacteria phage integrase